MRRVVVIDNFDSFTYNVAQAVRRLGVEVEVVRSDAVTVGELDATRPDGLILSPGPGAPVSVGHCDRGALGVAPAAYDHFRGRIPILGVCLGHQIIARQNGIETTFAANPVHGKTDTIDHDGSDLFDGAPRPMRVARYHSLAIAVEIADGSSSRGWGSRWSSQPPVTGALRTIARSRDGTVMAFAVVGEPTWGVQFHPESYMTEGGGGLFERFIDSRGWWRALPSASATAGGVVGRRERWAERR